LKREYDCTVNVILQTFQTSMDVTNRLTTLNVS